jgi:hypothetical protein
VPAIARPHALAKTLSPCTGISANTFRSTSKATQSPALDASPGWGRSWNSAWSGAISIARAFALRSSTQTPPQPVVTVALVAQATWPRQRPRPQAQHGCAECLSQPHHTPGRQTKPDCSETSPGAPRASGMNVPDGSSSPARAPRPSPPPPAVLSALAPDAGVVRRQLGLITMGVVG